MQKDKSIVDLMLIKGTDNENKYIVDRDSVIKSISGGVEVQAINVTGDKARYCMIVPQGKVLAAMQTYSLFGTDYMGYLNALKEKTEGEDKLCNIGCDSLVEYLSKEKIADSEKKLRAAEKLYPGLKTFVSTADGYNGNWVELNG